MDASFIQQNQVIERYLMGKLPLKGAQDFERWCREHPETVAQLGLADRINAALRLLDASGEPQPWVQKPPAVWQRPPVLIGLAAVAAALLVSTVMLAASGSRKSDRIAEQAKALQQRPIEPVQATRAIVMKPSRSGPVAASMVTIGAGKPELADFKYDLSWSSYGNFRVTIDRVGQGRVTVLNNLARDSNGHVRISFNSSALGPGDYTVEIEGIDWRGNTAPQAWARFSVAR